MAVRRAHGDAPSFPALVRDLDSFIAHIGAEHGIAVEDIVVIAQSVGRWSPPPGCTTTRHACARW
jgi:hypothetical protein